MLNRDGTAEPVSRDEILRRERAQGNTSIHLFSCSADHEQDRQYYSVDLYSCDMYVMTIQTYIHIPSLILTCVRQA